MSDFTCPSCGSATKTLLTGIGKLACPKCYTPVNRRSAALHTKAGCEGEAKNITEIDKKHIFNRDIGPDGKTAVCRDNPRKRWNW